MELTVIGISAAIAVLVLGLEAGRQTQKGTGLRSIQALVQVPVSRRTILLALGVTALISGGLHLLIPEADLWAWVLLGGLWGILSLGLREWGRGVQAIAVIAACLWTGIGPEVSFLQQLAALGLGLGLIGVPGWLVGSARSELSILTGLAQGWGLIAASTWGMRLADLMQGEMGWYRVLPCGLAALALVGGTVPLLVSDQGGSDSVTDPTAPLPPVDLEEFEGGPEPTASRALWMGRLIGGIVAAGLGGVLVRNWLHQGWFYPFAFGTGVGLSLFLLAIEAWGEFGLTQPSQEPTEPTLRLQQGILNLALVGGGALLALRFGGSYGAAVIGLGALTFPSRWGMITALFLAARPLVQSLLYEFDLNLSGINITHSYTYAALFLGIGGIGITLVVRWIDETRAASRTAIGLTTGTVLATALTGYFIHLRPQAAMVLGALMVSLVIAALEPVVMAQWIQFRGLTGDQRQEFRAPGWGIQGLVLSLLGILTALVSTDLTLLGAAATRMERLWVLGGSLLVVTVIGAVGSWGSRASRFEATP